MAVETVTPHEVVDKVRKGAGPWPSWAWLVFLSGLLMWVVAWSISRSPTQLWLAGPQPYAFIFVGWLAMYVALHPASVRAASWTGTATVMCFMWRALTSVLDGLRHGGRSTDIALRAAVYCLLSVVALIAWGHAIVPAVTIHARRVQRRGG